MNLLLSQRYMMASRTRAAYLRPQATQPLAPERAAKSNPTPESPRNGSEQAALLKLRQPTGLIALDRRHLTSGGAKNSNASFAFQQPQTKMSKASADWLSGNHTSVDPNSAQSTASSKPKLKFRHFKKRADRVGVQRREQSVSLRAAQKEVKAEIAQERSQTRTGLESGRQQLLNGNFGRLTPRRGGGKAEETRNGRETSELELDWSETEWSSKWSAAAPSTRQYGPLLPTPTLQNPSYVPSAGSRRFQSSGSNVVASFFGLA